MEILLDKIVVEEGNETAFKKVVQSSSLEVPPFNMVMYGPVGSGKSTAMAARASNRDLLSTKQVDYYHTEEVLLALNHVFPEEFFERMGSVDVLLLDELSRFVRDASAGEDGEIGGLALCLKLLVNERKRLNLTTIIASDVDPSLMDLSFMEGALDDFEFVEVNPLSDAGRAQLANIA